MPRFVLIEQSMRKLGGHFYPYALEILRAAEAAGWEPVLATNRRFQPLDRLPAAWPVYPVFPYASDRIHRVPRSYGPGLGAVFSFSAASVRSCGYRVAETLTDRFKCAVSNLRWCRRWIRVRAFAAGCQQLFAQVRLQEGDQVFCSTMSDMDLLGLVRYLARHEESVRADWHLQFHFRIYSGREPDYDRQERRTGGLRRRFAAALGRVPHHRIHLYTTTEHLARQFRRLGVGSFQTLPWPASTRFRCGGPSAVGRRPLRLVCAGAARREKGTDDFRVLTKALWEDFLKPRRVQLLFQAARKRRTQAMIGLPRSAVTAWPMGEPTQPPDEPVVCVPHPLAPDEYVAYIQNADIGLLLYNAEEYYVRCSGILVEMLAAGVPIIVPGGCWLGDQVDQINGRYLDGLRAQSTVWEHRDAPSLRWIGNELPGSQPASGEQLTVGRKGATAEIALPPGAEGGDLLICARWLRPETPGCYLRCTLQQYASSGARIGGLARLVGPWISDPGSDGGQKRRGRNAPRLIHVVFPVHRSAAGFKFSLASAYHDLPITLGGLLARWLAPRGSPTGHRPAGYVGLTAADVHQVPELLRDMISNYAHYRRAAETFATTWNEQRAPWQTVHQLQRQSQRPLGRRARRAG